MVKAARKSRAARSVASNDDNEIEIGDVTDRVYPAGVPTDDDGAVANGGNIPVAQARQIGALNAPAAAANRRVAKQLDRAAKGESVSWNEDDPLQLFENIRQAWPGLAVRIYIKCVDTEETFPPPAMTAFKTSADFYDHVLKNVHKNNKSLKYEIQFKAAGNSSIRGKGLIVMPDMSDVQQPAAQVQQAVFNPYTGRYEIPQAQPPLGYGPSFNPYVQQQQPAAQAPVQQQQPQQPHIVIHNPMPQMQPPPQQQSMPQQQMQQPPPPVTVDPYMVQWMQQQQMQQEALRVQIAEALGGMAEARRQQVQVPAPVQQVQQQPQQQPQVQAPPGFTLQPIPGYIPPGFTPPPGYQLTPVQPQGVGAPPPQVGNQIPPPPPPPPQTQAKPAGPFGIDLGSIMSGLQQIETLKKTLGVGPASRGAQEEEEEEPQIAAPPAPPEPPQVVSVPLGPDADSLVYVHNKDGSPNVMGMIMGNLPKLPGFFEKAARAAGAVNHTVEQAARQRPINAVGHVVQQPRQQIPAQIVEAPPQRMSFIPPVPQS